MSTAEIKSTEKSKVLFILCSALILSIALSIPIASIVSRQFNTILNSGKWFSEKINLTAGVVGAAAFISTRVSLAQDRLQLGAWHGYNMVTTNKNFIPKVVQFTANVATNGNISFVFSKTDRGYKSIRLSAAERVNSEIVEVDSLGFITSRQTINFKLPNSVPVKLDLKFQQSSLEINVSGQSIGRFNIENIYPGKIGFRSEAGKTWVDDVFVEETDGSTFKESFKYKDFIYYFLAIFCGILGCFLIWDAKFWNNLNYIFSLRTFASVCFILVTAINYTDQFIFSEKYKSEPSLVELITQIAKARGIINTISGEEAVKSKLKIEESKQLSKKFQIVLLGSSQTWGAGAATEEFRLENMIEVELKKKTNKSNLKVINLAVSGFRSKQMIDSLFWSNQLKPAIVVINLGSNDVQANEVQEQLVRLAELSKKEKFKLLFINEANYFLDRNSHLNLTHAAINNVASEYKINVLNGDQLLELKNQVGYLWWDNVHLSSAGQKILAEAIANEIYRMAKPAF